MLTLYAMTSEVMDCRLGFLHDRSNTPVFNSLQEHFVNGFGLLPLAVGHMIGLGAIGSGLGVGLLGSKFFEARHVSPS